MRQRVKTGGRDFIKGDPTIPKSPGRPKTPKELKELRVLKKPEVETMLHKVGSMSVTELRQQLKDESISVNEMYITKVFSVGISTGDPQRLSFVWDRMYGPLVKQISLTGPNGQPLIPTEHVVIELKDGKPFKQHIYKGS